LLIDDDGRPVGDALVFEIGAIFLRHLAFGVEILQERK
jgi:hypothetical protein